MNNTDNTGPGSPLRPALTVAEGLNADAISFARRASRDLGIPEQWVRGDLARIEREMAARRIEKNPALELWARQSPESWSSARRMSLNFKGKLGQRPKKELAYESFA